MDIVFNKIVVFKTNSPTIKGGGRADSYSTLVTTRGRLRKKSSSRGLQAGELGLDNGYELIVRYQSTIESNIRSDIKIVIDSVTYTIAGWEKVEEKNFYLKFDLNRQDG